VRSYASHALQTDDGAYTDVINCMMLAGLPGYAASAPALPIKHKNKNARAMRAFLFGTWKENYFK
jgi:hypothetical protein